MLYQCEIDSKHCSLNAISNVTAAIVHVSWPVCYIQYVKSVWFKLVFLSNNWTASTWTDLRKTSWEYSSNGNCNERRCSSFWTFLNSIMWYQCKRSSIQLYLSFDWLASSCLNHFHSVTFNLNEIVPLFEYIRQHSYSLSTFFWLNNIFHSLLNYFNSESSTRDSRGKYGSRGTYTVLPKPTQIQPP